MNALWNAFRRGDWPYGNTIRPRFRTNFSCSETHLSDLPPNPRYALDEMSRALWDLCDGRRTVGEIYGELCRRNGGKSQKLLATFTKNMLCLHELGRLELEADETFVLEANKILDMRNIRFYVINCLEHTQKRKFMERQLLDLQLKFEFVKGVECTPSYVGVALSHLKILRRSDLQIPFAILEDDCQFTNVFQPVIELPEMTDALYLGVSYFGIKMPGEFSWGVWNNTQYRQYTDDYLRVFNMLASHGIAYLSEKFRQGAIDASIRALTDLEKPYPMDIGLALLQNSHVVLTPNDPVCYQSEHHHGNHYATKHSLRRIMERQKMSDNRMRNASIQHYTP